ncbi:segregation/condensation protein A [Planctomycetaceae bacterium]|jgi:segregation and condensation protein A|nr:segregation/condensation protein A [Planctomycetaceae bacterium]
MVATEYRVHLDLFTGPLDLLLYLVRRQEVNILDLPVAGITQQYRQYIEVLTLIDVDLAADFLVMASSLAEIKSRMVLPRPEEEIEEPELETETQSELIQQLLEYKKFKEASFALEEHASAWQERYPRLSNERPKVSKDHSQDRIKEVELWDLVSALSRILETKEIVTHSKINYDETPIAVWAERISARVLAEGRCEFSSFFAGEKLRSRIVGIFLATLELIRHHHYRAEQPEAFQEIWILPPLESKSGPVRIEKSEQDEELVDED